MLTRIVGKQGVNSKFLRGKLDVLSKLDISNLLENIQFLPPPKYGTRNRTMSWETKEGEVLSKNSVYQHEFRV